MAGNTLDLEIDWADCDLAGIVFYPQFFRMMNTATLKLFERVGLPAHVLLARFGTAGLPMLDVQSTFKSPARFGDKATLQSTLVEFRDKTFVVDGHVAQTLIVAAQVEGGSGIVLLLVDPAQPGVQVERTVMVDAHNSARVRLNGVGVASDRVLVGPARGAQVLESLLDAGRAVLAAELVGAGDEVFARTLAYLKERKQFGKTIGEFQALQHRAAVLLTDLEMARAAVMKALQAAQAGGTSAARWVSVAKAKACAAGGLAAQEGVQMHGGIGMTDEFDMGLFMKRVRVLQELFGDASFHGDRLARIGGY